MTAPSPHQVPRVRPTVTSVELDGERVVYDTETGRVARLDPVGSVIWACFDGATSLAELAADLAGGFGVDVARVQEDVTALAGQLAGQGLLLVDG